MQHCFADNMVDRKLYVIVIVIDKTFNLFCYSVISCIQLNAMAIYPGAVSGSFTHGYLHSKGSGLYVVVLVYLLYYISQNIKLNKR